MKQDLQDSDLVNPANLVNPVTFLPQLKKYFSVY